MKFIAELCQNHNGDFSNVKDMVESVAEAGGTHVKLQHILADMLAFRGSFEEGVARSPQTIGTIKRPYKQEYDRLKGLELSCPQHEEFIRLATDAKIIPLVTAFRFQDLEPLRDLGYREIKIASYDCGSFPMLQKAADIFDHVYVSTGATLNTEIAIAAKILPKEKSSFLHCVTIYPTPLNQFNLARLDFLRSFGRPVGFSDHSSIEDSGIRGTKVVLARGVDLVERHFTYAGPSESRDGPVSINQDQLRELVRFSQLEKQAQKDWVANQDGQLESICEGSADRKLSDIELLNRQYYRGRFVNRFVDDNGQNYEVFNWESILNYEK